MKEQINGAANNSRLIGATAVPNGTMRTGLVGVQAACANSDAFASTEKTLHATGQMNDLLARQFAELK